MLIYNDNYFKHTKRKKENFFNYTNNKLINKKSNLYEEKLYTGLKCQLIDKFIDY